MESGSDDADHVCPLCMEEMDLTDRRFQPCQCGYQICLWCWHQIMELAGKNNAEGRCPACRTPYDKEKIVSASPPEPEELNESNSDKKQKGPKLKTRPTDGRKHLSNVRVVQRNLVYVVGLPLNIADEEVLERREYFGQYGKILKIAVSRASAYNAPHSGNGPTASVYVTFVKEEDALKCIQAVDGCMLETKQLRACFGTTKYCNAWLKNVTCNNPDCLYLHEIGTQEDSFTKEEMLTKYGSKHQTFHDLTHPPARRTGPGLPPPPPDPVPVMTAHVPVAVSPAQPPPPTQLLSSGQPNVTPAKPTIATPVAAVPRTSGLPPAASWGSKAATAKAVLQTKVAAPPSAKLRTVGVSGPGPPSVSSTHVAAGTTVVPISAAQGVYRPSAAVLSGRVIQASAHPPPIVPALILSTSPGASSASSITSRPQANGTMGVGNTNSSLLRHTDGTIPALVTPGSSPPIRQGIFDSTVKQTAALVMQQQVKVRARQVVVAHGVPPGMSIANGTSTNTSSNGSALSTDGIVPTAPSSQGPQTLPTVPWPNAPSFSSVLEAGAPSLAKEGSTESNGELSGAVTKGLKPSSFAAVASAGAARNAAAVAMRGLHVSGVVAHKVVATEKMGTPFEIAANVMAGQQNNETNDDGDGESSRSGGAESGDQLPSHAAFQKVSERIEHESAECETGNRKCRESDKVDYDSCTEASMASSEKEAEETNGSDGSSFQASSLSQEEDKLLTNGPTSVVGKSDEFNAENGGLLGFGVDVLCSITEPDTLPDSEIAILEEVDAEFQDEVEEEGMSKLSESVAEIQSVEQADSFKGLFGKRVSPTFGEVSAHTDFDFPDSSVLAVVGGACSTVSPNWQSGDEGQIGSARKAEKDEVIHSVSAERMKIEGDPLCKEKDDSSVIADILGLDFDIWGDGPFGAPGDLAKLLFSGVGTDRVKPISAQPLGVNASTGSMRGSGPAKQSRFQFARLENEAEDVGENVSESSLFSSSFPFAGPVKNGYHVKAMDACGDEASLPSNVPGSSSMPECPSSVSVGEEKGPMQTTSFPVQTPFPFEVFSTSTAFANPSPAPTARSAAVSGLTAPPGFSAPLLSPAMSAPLNTPSLSSAFSVPPGFTNPQGVTTAAVPKISPTPSVSTLSSSLPLKGTVPPPSSSPANIPSPVLDSSLADLEFVDPAIMAVGRGLPETRPAGLPSTLQNSPIGWLFGQRPPPPLPLGGTANNTANTNLGGPIPPALLFQQQSGAHHMVSPLPNFGMPVNGRAYPPNNYVPTGFGTFSGPFARLGPQLEPMFPSRPAFQQTSTGQLLSNQLANQPGNHLQIAAAQSGGIGLNQFSGTHLPNGALPGLQLLLQPGHFQSQGLNSAMAESLTGVLSVPMPPTYLSSPLGGLNNSTTKEFAASSEMMFASSSVEQMAVLSNQISSSATAPLPMTSNGWSGGAIEQKGMNWAASQGSDGILSAGDLEVLVQREVGTGHDRLMTEKPMLLAPTSGVTSPLLNKALLVSTPEAGLREDDNIVKTSSYAKNSSWVNNTLQSGDVVREEGLGSKLQVHWANVLNVGGEHGNDFGHILDRSSQPGDRDGGEAGEGSQDGNGTKHMLNRQKKEQKEQIQKDQKEQIQKEQKEQKVQKEQKRKNLKVRREREMMEKEQNLLARTGKGNDGATGDDLGGSSVEKVEASCVRGVKQSENSEENHAEIMGVENKTARSRKETPTRDAAQDGREKLKGPKQLQVGPVAAAGAERKVGSVEDNSVNDGDSDGQVVVVKVGSNNGAGLKKEITDGGGSECSSIGIEHRPSGIGKEEGVTSINPKGLEVNVSEQQRATARKTADESDVHNRGGHSQVRLSNAGKLGVSDSPHGTGRTAKGTAARLQKKEASSVEESNVFVTKSSRVDGPGKGDSVSVQSEKTQQDKQERQDGFSKVKKGGGFAAAGGKGANHVQEQRGNADGLNVNLTLQQRLEEWQVRRDDGKVSKGGGGSGFPSSKEFTPPSVSSHSVGPAFHMVADLDLEDGPFRGLSGSGQVESLEREVANAREVERVLESRLMEVKEWIDKDNALLEGIAANAPTSNFLFSSKLSFCTCGRDSPCEK